MLEYCDGLGLLGNISTFCKSHNKFAPPKPGPVVPPPPIPEYKLEPMKDLLEVPEFEAPQEDEPEEPVEAP